MRKFRLTREDDADIGFATDCLIARAISFEEFKKWIYYIIEKSDEIPNYLIEIVNIDKKTDYTLKVNRILGFWPGWGAIDEEYLALHGIGFRRFPDHKTDAASRDQAVEALKRNPQVERKFRELFPFIEW